MLLGFPKENHPDETRVALIPAAAERLLKKGFQIAVEKDFAASIRVKDADYEKIGAAVLDRGALLSSADVVIRVRKPPQEEIPKLKKNAVHISFLDPFNEKPLIEEFVKHQISAISMEMIPRTTLAQKMDALSSQANLAGYVSVVLAAERIDKILPMMMTPAGTIAPARVFVIGAGVAGLQAIATAKRLGARVEAFDTRPVVEEQVQSLGAKFIKIDLGETGQTKDGYAKALTEDQLAKQRQEMAKIMGYSDIVITTAQVFGRRAPVIITKEMLEHTRPGTVVVDLAVESGGNVEGAVLGEEVVVNGVRILGLANLPGRVAAHASQMYSSNIVNLLESYWDNDSKSFKLNLEDEIIQGCLITHAGQIVNKKIQG